MAEGCKGARIPSGISMERLVQLLLAGEVLTRRDEQGPLARPWGSARRAPERKGRRVRREQGEDV